MPTDKDWDYFLDNKDKLMKNYPGCYVVIGNGKFCGAYADECNAVANAPKYGSDLLIMHLDPAGVKEYKLKI